MPSQPRASLVVCVTGTECTGKTTLAAKLATSLAVPLVPEVARAYLSGRPAYAREDVLAIARAQQAAERQALEASAVVVADTDLTVIQVWWEEKFGQLDPWIIEALAGRTNRRYLLTRPDVPWEPDPLRESPLDRDRLHQRYLRVLESSRFPCCEVSGLGAERVTTALEHTTRWLAEWRKHAAAAPCAAPRGGSPTNHRR